MTPQQMNVYQLAENLGVTVTRMQREMTLSEYFGWIAFYAARDSKDKPKTAKKPPRLPRNGEITLQGFS